MTTSSAVDKPKIDGPWAHRLGHLLWEVSALANLLGESELAASPLSPRSLGTLDRIAAAPGTTVAEIARGTPNSQQAVSQVVARLDKLGFIERRLGPGRGVGLHITEAGAQARALGQECEEATEAHLRQRLGETTYEELRALLEQARDRLSDLITRSAPSKETSA